MRVLSKLLMAVVVWSLFIFDQPAEAGELLEHEASHSTIRLVLEKESLAVGETGWLAAVIKPRDGWHSYWVNPGDSGAAPLFEWQAPKGVEFGTPQFAAPKRIPVEHLMNYGYTGASIILFPVSVGTEVRAGDYSALLAAEWLVCDLECVPQVAEWQIQFSVNASADEDRAAKKIFREAREKLPEPAYWASELLVGEVSSELTIFADERELEGLESAYYFPISDGIAAYAGEQVWQFGGEGLLLRIPKDRSMPAPQLADGILELNFKNGDSQTFEMEPTLQVVESRGTANQGALFSVMPLWQAGLYAFLGGLILNLMPCVFPILSLKAFAFVAANYKTAANRRKEGWAYTLGIWLSFMAIVAALQALRAGGAAVGWGFQLQEPVFVGLLALLMVFVALSLAGLFNISFGAEAAGQNLAGREGAQGAFFKGVLATLVATPCTAPLMAPAIGFALTQPSGTVVFVFSLLAFGLAVPFLLLSYSARVAAMMPKPGPWMEKVKQGLAFPMLLTAVWLVYVFDLQAGASATLVLLITTVFVAFAVWLWGQSKHRLARTIALVIGVLSVGAMVQFALQSNTPRVAENEEIQTYSEQRLNQLLAEGQPVFVYFTAEWCITCKVNEQVALFTDATKEAFFKKDVTLLKGDWTNRNDEIARVLASYGRAGVPLYLYFPKGLSEAIVLPELITPSSIIDIL